MDKAWIQYLYWICLDNDTLFNFDISHALVIAQYKS